MTPSIYILVSFTAFEEEITVIKTFKKTLWKCIQQQVPLDFYKKC